MSGLLREAKFLTPHQRQVYDKLLLGKPEKDIAVELRISPHTVHGAVKRVYREYGVASRAELLALVIDQQRERIKRLEEKLAAVRVVEAAGSGRGRRMS